MSTEQSNDQSGGSEANAAAKPDVSLKSVAEFKAMPLADMEKELNSKDYSKATADDTNDQDQQNSDHSDEASKDEEQDSSDEQTSEDTDDTKVSAESSESDDSESDETDTKDKQKKKEPSTEERLASIEKSNKELQAEFTRRSQRLKELEKENADLKSNSQSSKKDEDRTSDEESDPELAQLKQKDPKAYDALNKMIDRLVDKRVTEKVKPVEEQVTLRRRQENVSSFDKAIDGFKESSLSELEPQMVDIINENPSEWQRKIWDSGEKAFQELEKELLYRHRDAAAKLISKADKSANAKSDKQERLKGSQVGTKTKVSQPARGVVSDDDFRKLSLEDMEKRLPKVRS